MPSPDRQAGLYRMDTINMHDPNIDVWPVITIDKKHHLNAVYFNKVRVPASNVVGEPGRGWHNARFLLANERVLLAQAPRNRQRLNDLRRLRAFVAGHMPASEYTIFSKKLTKLEIDLMALDFAAMRVLVISNRPSVV
jgi:alkylation response protein AidB-like acyl-CoA dehydrogenase